MDIHLDLLGGLAGDMFVAALLDAHPHHFESVERAVRQFSAASNELSCALLEHRDGTFQGRRFAVRLPVETVSSAMLVERDRQHSHATWQSIAGRIRHSQLTSGAKQHALAIFQLLADAESHVHGVAPDEVTFHEVGAWDSIADTVAAAVLIDCLRVVNWTSSALPIGGGRVRTAHGIMPLPAPATARLMIGMQTLDDGIAGERVTPTGAAILRYLCPPGETPVAAQPTMRTLMATGVGFGLKSMPGISTCVRALCFSDAGQPSIMLPRRLSVLEFEVDDQTGEELALGLDRLRVHPGVLDVTQSAVFGKKGRMMAYVRVLAKPSLVEDVVQHCFHETTTIGLRCHLVDGVGLKRKIEHELIESRALRVKVVERPDGRTAKTEADDVSTLSGHFARARMRARAESQALCADSVAPDA